ncbi:hypothetical protein PI124_g7589 [Phytophthora idaei]|nr:hypothetical protein PI125_g7221 [Phytophthora idaei]KAG3152099.1 hypothetical protein PI126_g10679 [Phytophthora idaei]KAG3247730.1 hypothetical protein PI124_g7589 [Phytophthora idaei]
MAQSKPLNAHIIACTLLIFFLLILYKLMHSSSACQLPLPALIESCYTLMDSSSTWSSSIMAPFVGSVGVKS